MSENNEPNWLDYISKLNDRALTKKQATGVTTWAILGVIGILLIRIIDQIQKIISLNNISTFFYYYAANILNSEFILLTSTISIYDDNVLLASYQEAQGKNELVGNRLFYEQLKRDQEQVKRKYGKNKGKATMRLTGVDLSLCPECGKGKMVCIEDLPNLLRDTS